MCSILLYIKWSPSIGAAIPKLNQYGPEYAIIFFFIVFFITVSLAIGHLCSVFARNILRPVLHLVFGDPEISIFASSHSFSTDKRFYSAPFISAISRRFTKVFGLEMEDSHLKSAVPRMIRTYVFLHGPAALVIRSRIVRARSICGNLVVPIFLAILLFYPELGRIYSAVLIASAALLIVKQVSLDIRESKEVYTAFLSLKSD